MSGRPLVLRGVSIGDGPLVDMRIADGRVEAITGAGESPVRAGEELLHLPGGHVLPGLVDGHVHWTQWSGFRRRIDVSSATSASHVAELVAAGAGRPARADFVRAQGFQDAMWSTPPHRDQLERALPGVAVAIVSMDLHTTWLSPAALDRLGIDHPTGVLREGESFDVQRRLTADEPGALTDRWVVEASAAAAAKGITEILDFEFADNIASWTRRAGAGRLDVRVQASIWEPWLAQALDAGLRSDDPLPGTGGLVRVGPLKVIADGSLNTRTAYCYHAYPDPADEHDHGMLLIEPEELQDLMKRAVAGGLSPAIHAIGDRANAVVLDAFDAVGGGGRIEHAQLVDETDLARFARPGLVASVQPQHAMSDRDVADHHWAGTAQWAFPYGSLVRAGATLHLGSDAPVAEPDPWQAVAAAVSRTDDERPPWYPEQSIDLPTALAAASAGRSGVAVGDPADLVVVGLDPHHAGPSELREMPVLATLVAGRPTYRRD